MEVRVGLWRKLNAEELMHLYCVVWEDCWESLGLQGDPTSPSWRSVLGVQWKDWCWSWNSSILATSCEVLTHWKRPWCWEGLGAGGEGDDRRWDGWMASLTRWAWVWVNSGSLWWTGRPGMLRFMGSQRVGHDWVTELNWTVWFWDDFMECSTLHFLQRHLSFLSLVVVVVFIYHFPIFEGNLGRFKGYVITILPFLLLFKLHKKDTKIPFHSPVSVARPHIKTHRRT